VYAKKHGVMHDGYLAFACTKLILDSHVEVLLSTNRWLLEGAAARADGGGELTAVEANNIHVRGDRQCHSCG
jgi:hypothetical protein